MARGREAESPRGISSTGWKDVFFRVKDEIAEDRVGLTAAGIAFYTLLAIFPALTAFMALSGLMFEPQQITARLDSLTVVLSQEAAQIILDQAVDVAGSQKSGLGLAFFMGTLIAIVSASKGMGSLMAGLNIAYDEDESRGFLRKTLVKVILTAFVIVGLLMGIGSTVLVSATLEMLPWGGAGTTTIAVVRWLTLGVMTIVALAVIYRYGPSRDNARWQWLIPGALAACVIWLAASIGFSLFVSNFGRYNETFGSVAGVIFLLMWLWISAFIILAGAELNAEMEAQTRVDTTIGPRDPMGERGAEKADRLGDAH